MSCSVLQCVAVNCSELQCVAVCCSAFQCVPACCSVLRCVAACCSVVQCRAVSCNVVQCVAVCCSVLQRVAVCCSLLQRVAVSCSVVQCIVMSCSVLQCRAVCCSVLHSLFAELEVIFFRVTRLDQTDFYTWYHVISPACTHVWQNINTNIYPKKKSTKKFTQWYNIKKIPKAKRFNKKSTAYRSCKNDMLPSSCTESKNHVYIYTYMYHIYIDIYI